MRPLVIWQLANGRSWLPRVFESEGIDERTT